jgi:hypothetical protein
VLPIRFGFPVRRPADPGAKPLPHLSEAAATWLRSIEAGWELDIHDRALAHMAAEAKDRAESARVILERDGVIVTDRFAQPKAHPAVRIEAEARAAFARLIRQLDLDADPTPPPPRNQWRPKRSRGRG